MELQFFKDFDFTDFWNESSYSVRDYIEEFPDDEMIASIKNELGYKLPASYIELMKFRMGDWWKKAAFRQQKAIPGQKTMLRLRGFWESEEKKHILFVES